MGGWAPIEVADALELLSPDFKNDEARAGGRVCKDLSPSQTTAARLPPPPRRIQRPPNAANPRLSTRKTANNAQVRSHAVAVLQQKDDEELLYYLLQLVQVGGGGCVFLGGWILWGALPKGQAVDGSIGWPAPSLVSKRRLPSPQALRFEAVDLSRLARFLTGPPIPPAPPNTTGAALRGG